LCCDSISVRPVVPIIHVTVAVAGSRGGGGGRTFHNSSLTTLHYTTIIIIPLWSFNTSSQRTTQFGLLTPSDNRPPPVDWTSCRLLCVGDGLEDHPDQYHSLRLNHHHHPSLLLVLLLIKWKQPFSFSFSVTSSSMSHLCDRDRVGSSSSSFLLHRCVLFWHLVVFRFSCSFFV